jgi:hypothetical protein
MACGRTQVCRGGIQAGGITETGMFFGNAPWTIRESTLKPLAVACGGGEQWREISGYKKSGFGT